MTEMSKNNKNKIFNDIMNTNNSNNNKNNNKCKQKSILDYFNKSQNKLNSKRSSDCLDDNSFPNKLIKIQNNDITIVSNHENRSADHLIVDENVVKTNEVLRDVSNEEFIDLNQFLEIDVSIEENQKNVSTSDELSDESNHMKGSYVYNTFRQMIEFCLSDKQFSNLFDSSDLSVIQSFTCLSGLAQILFMRLFMRKRFWIRNKSIKYPEIADNLQPILEELVENQFLLNANHLSEITESLDVLETIEMKRIVRSLNGFNSNGLNTKKNISAAVVKYLNTCQPVFKSDKQSDSITEVLLKSIKSVLKDKCFRVNEKLCDVFERMFLLFCRPEINDEDFNSHLNFEFFKILRVDSGKDVYPKYTINKNTDIYKTRDDLIRYSLAFKLEIDILSAIQKKDLDEVVNHLMNRAKQGCSETIEDKEDQNDRHLPQFLRPYTGGQSYIRCLSHCVSVLEQKKRHSEAVSILKDILLKQTIYCEDLRGRWYERLALNLDKHLKEPNSALEIIQNGLNDELVRTGHRFALYIRQKNIQKSLKISISLLNEFENIKYNETVIFAETIKYTINDRKNIFKTTDAKGEVTIMSVEDIVVNHYKNNGFTDGLHTESTVYHTILVLLFWDIIYMSESCDVFDAFRFRYQRLPLDFNSDQFFIRRKTQILSLLNTLRNLNQTEINNILENSFNINSGTVSLINWENTDINQIKQISSCFGSSVIANICERLIKDFRHTRSGFPDLLVWNTSTKQIKVVEVKGPNDRPSTKQQLWLSFIASLGVEVEICHVKAKKIL